MSVAGRLSVVIPTLNEHDSLPALLDDLLQQQDINLECVVVDGGSDDGTAALARERGVPVVETQRGRGHQLNAGARAATGEWLLFLHADTRLSGPRLLHDALAALRRETATGAIPVAGHFALRFARSRPGHDRLFAFLEAKTASNRRYSINGDQGLMIRRCHFDALGGYDESLPIFEDQRIAARIFESGRWVLLPGSLVTSARRFEAEGHRERYTLMAMMMGLHYAGLHEFFREAPQVYAAQHEAQRLQLTPFRRLVLRLLRQRGWREAATIVWMCGRLARENAWQLALLRDLRSGRGDDRSLRGFDRNVAPLLDNPLADGITAVLVTAWFMLWLPLQRGL